MDGTAFDFPSHGGMGHKFSSVPKQVFFSNISRNRKTVLTGLLNFIHCDISVAIFFLALSKNMYLTQSKFTLNFQPCPTGLRIHFVRRI